MENFEIAKSKVYIKIDENNRVLRCEGGYTMGNITNIDEWILIDEGDGDKYNLCQSHYFEGGLYTMEGVPRYKYEDGVTMLRSDEEIQADIVIPEPQPPEDETKEDIWAELDRAYQEGVDSI